MRGNITVIVAIGSLAGCGSASPVSIELRGSPTLVGPMAGRPALGDLDGDGDLDAVVVCGPCCGRDPSPDSGHLVVLLNDGTGVLAMHGMPIKLGETALGVSLGDLNHDGDLDAAVYHHSSYRVSVLVGDGRGMFERAEDVVLHEGESPHVHSIAIGDVNGDGHADLAATLVDDHALAVHLGDGHGGFSAALGQPFFAFRHPYSGMQLTDLNGDDHLDAVLTDMRGNGMSVLVGSGTGMFASSVGFRLSAHTAVTSAERPASLALGDLDDDGDLDAVLATDESESFVVMMNMGGGVFREHEENPVRAAVISSGIALGDLDSDGAFDIVGAGVGGVGERRISYTMGLGGGRFGESFAVDAGGESPSVVVGDMNGDGVPDVVTGNYDSGTVSVLIVKRTD